MRISQQQGHKCENKLIFERLKSCEDLKFNQIIESNDKIIIEGKEKMVKIDKKWLVNNWKKYQNKVNHCLYICIDRPPKSE